MFRKPFSFVSRDTDFANDRKEVVFGQLHPKRPTRMILDTSESGHWPQLTIPRRVPSYDRPTASIKPQSPKTSTKTAFSGVRVSAFDRGRTAVCRGAKKLPNVTPRPAPR